MKIVIAPDSFKGSLSSQQVIDTIDNEAKKVFENPIIAEVPIADGGEGTVDALVKACNGKKKAIQVKNPIGDTILAEYGELPSQGKVVMEMAACSGLPLLDEKDRNPLYTSTYGTGQMLNHLVENGCKDILIGIGGSATNDGGMGMARALGVKFLDSDGNELEGRGIDLERVASIDTTGFFTDVYNCNISVMCDVNNPLTGQNGATRVYGKQKGGTPEILDRLEKGMLNYEKVLNAHFGKEISMESGAGAAGGLGASLLAFCTAKLVSGIDTVLETVEFDDIIFDADMIVTGEGRVDNQSVNGKVIDGVASYAAKSNVPVFVIAGGVGDDVEKVYDIGVDAIFALPNRPMQLDDCMGEAEKLLKFTAYNLFRTIKRMR